MTQEQLNSTGYIYNRNENRVIEISYKEFLDEFGSDETTTPRGVGERSEIVEVTGSIYKHDLTGEEITEDEYEDLTEEEEDNYTYVGEGTVAWELREWSADGRLRSTGQSFDSEEDAELALYDGKEWVVTNGNWDAPQFHDSFDDAVEDMANQTERTEEVVRRYLNIRAISSARRRREAEVLAKQNEARKAQLSVDVKNEAAAIVIDDKFVEDIKIAGQATGQEKSRRMGGALKGLLGRSGIEEVKSDFWQVLRILKAKAEQMTL